MHVVSAAVPGSSSESRMPLAMALPMADVVTLHCPLTEKTRGLVDGNFLSALKPGAILLNTGRGPLIDQGARIEALDAGRLGGVGLDVLEKEPPPAEHPLLNPKAPWARKVVVTPHIGWATVEARHRLLEKAAANLSAFLSGQSVNRVA
jgi:glycerate dehydrogenase